MGSVAGQEKAVSLIDMNVSELGAIDNAQQHGTLHLVEPFLPQLSALRDSMLPDLRPPFSPLFR